MSQPFGFFINFFGLTIFFPECAYSCMCMPENSLCGFSDIPFVSLEIVYDH